MVGAAVAALGEAVVRIEGNPRGREVLGVGLDVSCKGGREFFEFLTGTFLGGMMNFIWPYRRSRFGPSAF